MQKFLKTITLLFCVCGVSGVLAGSAQAAPFTVKAKTIAHFDRLSPKKIQFGKLEFLGGLELTSPDNKRFGGLSGFTWTSADRFVAVTDRGRMIRGRLQVSSGRPVGVDMADMQPLRRIMKDKRQPKMDSEGLDFADNRLWVSFEGLDRLAYYKPRSSGILPIGRAFFPDKKIINLNEDNKGFESIAVAPKGSQHSGAVVLISENVGKEKVNGWFLKGGRYTAFSLPKVGGLRPTDAAFLPNGDLLILERSFSLLGGLKIQLRRIFAKDLSTGHISRYETLFLGDLRYELDNMEGLAVQGLPDGSAVLTMVSDDNFNSLQRTLLLQFHLKS